MIAQLKAEVQRLKDELAMATGQEYTGELTENEMDRYCENNKASSLLRNCRYVGVVAVGQRNTRFTRKANVLRVTPSSLPRSKMFFARTLVFSSRKNVVSR